MVSAFLTALLIGTTSLFATPAPDNREVAPRPVGVADTTDRPPMDQCRALAERIDPPQTCCDPSDYWATMTPALADSFRTYLSQYDDLHRCVGDRVRTHPLLFYQSYIYEAFLYASLRQLPEAFRTVDTYFERYDAMTIPDSLRADHRKYRARMHEFKGFVHFNLGDFSTAIGEYSTALTRLPESEPGLRILALYNLGTVIGRTGDMRSQGHYYHRALQVARTIENPSEEVRSTHAQVLVSLANMARGKISLSTRPDPEQLRKVFSLLERSKEVYSKEGTHLNAFRNHSLARAYSLRGDYDEAVRRTSSSLERARRSGDITFQVVYLRSLGHYHARVRKYDPARRAYLEALSLARDLGDLSRESNILYNLGLLAEQRGRLQEAEEWYRQGIDVAEQYRSSLRATQWSTTGFGTRQGSFRGLTRVLAQTDRPREAFQVLEQTRARHLTDLRIQQKLTKDLSPSQRIRYDSLTQNLDRVRNQLSNAASPSDSLRLRESRLVAERRQMLTFNQEPDAVDVDSIQSSLQREDRVLISYFLDDPLYFSGRSPKSYAFLVTADTLQALPLPDVTEVSVEQSLSSISPLFASDTTGALSINSMNFDLRSLHALHEKLVAPVEPYFTSNRLTIIPHGPLYRLPFSMLVSERPTGRFSHDDASYLFETYATSVELSSSLLTNPQTPPAVFASKDRALAAFGVSRFDSSYSIPSPLRASFPQTDSSSSVQLPPLPGVRRELRALQSTVANGLFALDDDASEAAFHEVGDDANILHLASHAFSNPASPFYNAFVLAPGDSSSQEDGWLFLHEIQSGSGNIPLVYLSGCSTAEGTMHSGEGMEGLQYAFRAMGARSTVSNLWPVDDGAAVDLSTSFYRFLREGHPKDVALQKAKARYLARHPDRASPFFWASTILYGSPEPIPLEAPSMLSRLYNFLTLRGTLLLLGGSILLLLGTTLVVRSASLRS